MANGITIGTNYRVYAVQKVQTVAGEIVQLVHLKVSRNRLTLTKSLFNN